jgi:hypothetical protein
LEVATEHLSALYAPVSFVSLTDVDAFTMTIPSSRYDCPAVLKSGIGGFRQRHTFDGYSARSDQKQLKELMFSQLKAVRLLCTAKALGEATGRKRESAARPDGDQITVYLDWLIGELSESISTTCQGPDAAGNWACNADGDFASLKQATAEESLEYFVRVDLTRTAGGQESRWTFSLAVEIPDPENPLATVVTPEGALPEDACNPGRYPGGSVMAYVLQHYADGCR